MGLNMDLYERSKAAVTGPCGLSPSLDAYARAYFNVPPVSGEWTEENMQQELNALIWNYHNGCLDLRRRSAETILKERLQSARDLLEKTMFYLNLANDDQERLHSFITRFHLGELYKEYLKEPRADTSDGFLNDDEELPFI